MPLRYERPYTFLSNQVGSALSYIESDLDNATCGREELIQLGVALKEALMTANDMVQEDSIQDDKTSGARR